MKLERAQATGDEACSESFRQDGTRTRDVTVELHGISDRRLSIETVSSPSKLGHGRLTIVPIKFINASLFSTDLLFLNLNDRKDHFLVKFYLLHPVRGSFLSMDKQFDELKLVCVPRNRLPINRMT